MPGFRQASHFLVDKKTTGQFFLLNPIVSIVNPYPADHYYCHFYYFLFVDKIAVIGNEMCVLTLRFVNICTQIKQI